MTEMDLGWKALDGNLVIPDEAEIGDTFFDFGCADCQDWSHGVLFVNFFNVGRYNKVH